MLIRTIKVLRRQKKQRKILQKCINHEVIEVLATICRYLEHEGRRNHNPMARVLGMQFDTLKDLSNLLRKEIVTEEQKNERLP